MRDKSASEEKVMPKQTITPGQALLILIDHYRDDSVKSSELKSLYLSGANSDENKRKMNIAISDKILEKYNIQFDPFVINGDPTRRYFETHLSYETVARELSSVTINELKDHLQDILDMIPPEKMQLVQHVLEGEFRGSDILIYQEYANIFSKIKREKMFEDFSEENKEKLTLIVKASFLGVYNAQVNPTGLPINIYGAGIFSDLARGKKLDSNQNSTRNQQLGLMKGHMPLALDDIALSPEQLPYLKPSDQSRFDLRSLWVKQNFDKFVHPFSNSISGTMLCQLRNMAMFHDMSRHHNPFYAASFTRSSEKMRSFTKLLMSTMLYATGGHSLNEYSAPLSLPEVSQFFSDILSEPLTLEALYNPQLGSTYERLSNAFDVAIEKAIAYNKSFMLKHELHAQIRGVTPVQSSTPESASLMHLSEAHLERESEELKEILASPLYSRWEVLIPELEHAQRLVKEGNFFQAKRVIENAKQSLPQRAYISPQHRQECANLLVGLKIRMDSAGSKAKLTNDYKERLKSESSSAEEISELTKENKLPRTN